MNEFSELDMIGIEEGTDKSTLGGGYLSHYDEWFHDIRHEAFNLLEIGVFHGGSVRTWTRYFDRAQIIGLDIDPRCREHSAERRVIEIGSQADPGFLHRVAAQYPPYVIIDDGSHRSDHTIFAFERLFPVLQAGGWYIVEDLHFHFMEHEAGRLRGEADVLASDYFAEIAKDRMRARQHTSDLKGLHKYIVDTIEEVRIIPQAVAFHKKSELSDQYLDHIRRHLEDSVNWLNWLSYGMLLRAHQKPLHETEAALRRALQIGPSEIVIYERLADFQFESGERQRAADTLQEAIELPNIDPPRAEILRERIRLFRRA